MFVQLGLQAHRHHAVEAVLPSAVLGLASGLAFNLIAFDGLAAVDAGADPPVDRGQVGVLTVGATPLVHPVGGKANGAAPLPAVGDNPDTPLLPCLLGQPAGVQQRRLPTAVRAGHLAAVEKTVQRFIQKITHHIRAFQEMSVQGKAFLFWNL